MDSQKCFYCESPPSHCCSCTGSDQYFCRSHRDDHEATIGEHIVKLIAPISKLANEEAKSKLLNELLLIRDQSQSKKNDIVNHSSLAIAKLVEQTSEILKKLSNFIEICEKLIKDICETKTLPSKQFYTPLETALLSSDIRDFLSEIYSPQVVFHELGKMFNFVPPPFFHTFFNFSTCSISYQNESILQVFTREKSFCKEKLHFSTRSMLVSPSKLLITGDALPNKNSVILDIVTSELSELSSFRVFKRGYAMTWIDGNPGVIGGRIENKNVKTVEVFKMNKLQMSPQLNFPRRGHSAVAFRNCTFVIGGLSDIAEKMDTIEKYENGQWITIEAKLISPCANPGLISLDNKILIVGGLGLNDKETSEVFLLDCGKMSIQKVKELDSGFAFAQNLFCVSAQEIKFYSKKGKEEKLELMDL